MFPSVSLWFSYVTISRKFRSSSSSSLPVVEPAGSRFIDSQRFGPGNTILSHRSNELRFGLSSSGDESDEFVGISVSGLLFAFLVTKNITGWWFGTCLKKNYWEFHHPNCSTHIFQRGRYTTNQIKKTCDALESLGDFQLPSHLATPPCPWLISLAQRPRGTNRCPKIGMICITTHQENDICESCEQHRCPFPIGWLIIRGVWRNPFNNR